MKKIASFVLAAALTCGVGACFAQEKNPNQQQQQVSPKNEAPPDNPGQNTPSQSNPDVPEQKPGTNNPDISPDSKPAAGTTAPESKGKRRKNRKNSSSTHTAPTV